MLKLGTVSLGYTSTQCADVYHITSVVAKCRFSLLLDKLGNPCISVIKAQTIRTQCDSEYNFCINYNY